MTIETALIEYTDDDVLLEGYLAYKRNSSPAPTVIIAHMWGGRVEFVCEKARQLAKLGYTAFALDMYGKGIQGSSPEESAKLMQPFMDKRAMLQQRITAALQTVRHLPQTDPDRIAAIGYCFGGLCVLDLARTGAAIKAVASIHGLLHPPQNLAATPIQAQALILHGSQDPMATMDDLLALQQELTSAGVDWQAIVYSHTQHAFTNPAANNPQAGTVYQATSSSRSWRALLDFLTEALA